LKFQLPTYQAPNFEEERFVNAPECTLETVKKDGVAPDNYHALSVYPEYYKIQEKWYLAHQSRMDCVPVFTGQGIEIVEFRNLKLGDQVVLGRTEDASQGIYLHSSGFKDSDEANDVFAFRTGRSRETAYSKDYDYLYRLLEYEKEHGYVVWVLGPAVSFDHDARHAVGSLVEKGYVDALLAGNALATHDLEGALLKTALGQDIYTQVSYPNGHYNHLDLINRVRRSGSIPKFIEEYQIDNGIIHACEKFQVPYVLAGSIRDDGPLPPVFGNAYEAQDAMRAHTRKATTVICLATQLHTIATGNMTPAYTEVDGKIRPVYIYSVDISEFVVNKLRDRGTLEVTTMVTNVQDFVVNLDRNLK
jgi:hypothetical protein